MVGIFVLMNYPDVDGVVDGNVNVGLDVNPGVYALQCALQRGKQVFFLVFGSPPCFFLFFLVFCVF